MAEYNITMNQLNAQGTYDTLNPTTKAGNVSDVTSASDYGLEVNASVDDVLTLLKNSVQFSGNNLTLPDGTNVLSQIESALGLPGAKIQTGSYTGTNRADSNTIYFSFRPALVFVYQGGGISSYTTSVIWGKSATSSRVQNNTVNISTAGNSITFWPTSQGVGVAFNPLNESGYTYYYVGIG